MADWSQLPKELLQLISERLDDSTLYLLRFRSVCSTWRSSIPKPQPPHLPAKFPLFPNSNGNDDASTFSVYKHTIFLIAPPQQHQRTLRPWLTAIGQDSCGQTHLWHPLFLDAPLRLRFPQELDFNQHRVFHLGHRFALPFPFPPTNMIKVVVATWQQAKSEGFCSVLLSILDSRELALFCCDEQRWTLIPDSPTPYKDVCLFKGRPCAVDRTGRTVMVGPDLSVDLVAEPEPETVLGGDMKYLVESEGGLLLVDMYNEDFYRNDGLYGKYWFLDNVVRVDVFRLEEKEKKWVQLTSLGDQILFLGYNCTFSASASDLGVGEGNCVIFREHKQSWMTAFHLDDGRFSCLSDPVYDQLFCPPRDWPPLHRQGGSGRRTDFRKDYDVTVIKKQARVRR